MICLNADCDLNDRNECVSPSSVKIGEFGICKTWLKIVDTKLSCFVGMTDAEISEVERMCKGGEVEG